MEYIEYTNIGRRITNQDFVQSEFWGDNSASFIVADGMGGYEEGGLAARVVAKTILECLKNGADVKSSVLQASKNLLKTSTEIGVKKMGCCIAGILITNLIANVFWSGDSRVYIIREVMLLYVSEDHSLVAKLEKHHTLSYSQRERYSNIVCQAIMGAVTDYVEEKVIELLPGDEIFICTDGIYKQYEIVSFINLIQSNNFDLQSHNEDFADNHSFIYVKI